MKTLSPQHLFFALALLLFGAMAAVAGGHSSNPPVQILDLSNQLRELSGFAYDSQRGTVWSLSDKGNGAALYEINLQTKTARYVQVLGVHDLDWEGLVFDGDILWILDTGNNKGKRQTVRLLGIRSSDLDQKTVSVFAQVAVEWPKKPQDVESGYVQGNEMILITKEPKHGPRFYSVDLHSKKSQVAQKIGELSKMPSVSDAVVFKKSLYLLTDKGLYRVHHYAEGLGGDAELVNDTFSGEFEALTHLPTGEFLIGNESGQLFLL